MTIGQWAHKSYTENRKWTKDMVSLMPGVSFYIFVLPYYSMETRPFIGGIPCHYDSMTVFYDHHIKSFSQMTKVPHDASGLCSNFNKYKA